MLTGSGRPRKACSTCKAQKIRCSGERPVCKRCQRLKHSCVYNTETRTIRDHARSTRSSDTVIAEASSASAPSTPTPIGRIPAKRSAPGEFLPAAPVLPLGNPYDEQSLGIPKVLVLTLVDVYFDNVYNANLLLHKRLFLASLAAGTARPHVVLSVCAWAANFYRDPRGQATLKNHGFMLEWAHRAGRLVFHEAEDFHEENIVTFCNLNVFWHSQGSWRKSLLYKGNACQLLYIVGFGPDNMRTGTSLESEVRRRRYWACYLTHCHLSERLSLFQLVDDMPDLPLPWTEEEFEAGISTSPQSTLRSEQSHGIFAEMIKILTLWSSVVALIKSPDDRLNERLSGILTLDAELSDWWRKLKPEFKLSSSNMATVPQEVLPKVLLVNIVYHQSMCSLHASIVPLFCWSAGSDSGSSARQLSAQMAYEHAGEVSALIDAASTTIVQLSAIPGFVAYSAYCSCAIQIPFMWCLNPVVKERAHTNVKANVSAIHMMAEYFKFAAVLRVHVRCLFNVHKRDPIILEDEPKYIDSSKLLSCKGSTAYARSSILEYTGILRQKGTGYAEPGEEMVAIANEDETAGPRETETQLPLELTTTRTLPEMPNQLTYSDHDATSFQPLGPTQEASQPSLTSNEQLDPCANNDQGIDIFYPFQDPQMFGLFPNGEVPDFLHLGTSPLSLDYFEIGRWEDPMTAPHG